jgi:hypothetical protein
MPSSNRPAWLVSILESESAFKTVAMTYFVIALVAAFGLIKLTTDDPEIPKDFGVLVAVLCIPVAGLLAGVTLNRLGAQTPLISEVPRLRVYAYAGFAIALTLAVVLSIYNHQGTQSQRKSADDDRIARDERARLTADPDVQRGLQFLNARRQQLENASTRPTRATTRPVTRP